jgi:hypothetical protein
MAAHLLIIGERDALAWVLREQRMAFPSYRRQEASALQPGDELLLYTTRGCFHNPGRDRGRVIGLAEAVERPVDLPQPFEVAGRTFTVGCRIEIGLLTPLGDGVELAPLVPELASFPNKHGWATRLRRPLVSIAEDDAKRLVKRLRPRAQPPAEVLSGYLAAARSPVR